MNEQVELTCKGCGNKVMRKPLPEPKNGRERNNIRFICPKCGAKNTRDGRALYIKSEAPNLEKTQENQETPKETKPKRSIKNAEPTPSQEPAEPA